MWNRRVPKPLAPAWVSKADASMVEEQCINFVHGVRHSVSRGTFTANDPSVENNAAKKLLQIKVALECGFAIPDTLASNDPDAVARFWHERQGRVVVKPFVGAAWENDGRVHNFLTTMMPEPTAELRDSIRSAPCIYQRVIEDRRFDVRLVYIDGRIFACSIKGLTTGMVDIRKDITHGRATHERIEIPGPIAARVRDYCDRLDLRYGAFDFIVDAEDCWWFLECNSAGQFLWLEEGLPDIGLLDAFCKMFLRHMGTPFDDSIVVRLDEFRASGIWQAEQAAWPGPHKPGMIIGGFRPEDEEDLALLS